MRDKAADSGPRDHDARTEPDLIIFVHGTFSASDEEAGPQWWQRESGNWTWMQAHLPPDTELLDESIRLFRWDGRNSQAGRLNAANRLLAFMLELERQGRNYHLVGHSHGGSVIWEALVGAEVARSRGVVDPELRRALNCKEIRLGDEPLIPLRDDEYAPVWVKYKTRYIPRRSEYTAIRSELELRGLRSWSTVGTPFMRYFPVRRPLVTGWRSGHLSLHPPTSRRQLVDLLIDLLLTLTIIGPVIFLGGAIFASMAGVEWPRSTLQDDIVNALSLPFAIWWILAFWILGAQNYANKLLHRERAGVRAFRRFSDRWLGLWSPLDEALNALSATARHEIEYEWVCKPVTHREPRDMPRLPTLLPLPGKNPPEDSEESRSIRSKPVDVADVMPDLFLSSPRRVIKPISARVRRRLDPVWRRHLAKLLTCDGQGSDLPGAVAAYVSPWPIPVVRPGDPSGLPEDVITRLNRRVQNHNSALGTAVREMLMAAALEGFPAAIQAVQEDQRITVSDAFVHTSYFSDLGVRKLILLHVRRNRRSGQVAAESSDDELASWYARHVGISQERLADFLAATGLPL